MARVDDYRESFRLAEASLITANVHRLAKLAGADVFARDDGGYDVHLEYVGDRYSITVGKDVKIVDEGKGEEPSLPVQILLCHYLLSGSQEAPTGELVAFRQVPDGRFYFDAFQRRARDPLLATFGKNLDLFRQCVSMAGGELINTGDAGASFRVLPKVTIRYVLWEGDDEFPPDANILFDSNIHTFFPAEDIALLASLVVYKLMGIARGLK